jgi:hypothetical protein
MNLSGGTLTVAGGNINNDRFNISPGSNELTLNGQVTNNGLECDRLGNCPLC